MSFLDSLDPRVRDYMLKKKEEEAALEQESQGGVMKNTVAPALAAISAGFMGKDPNAAGMAMHQNNAAQKKAVMDNFQKQKAGELEGFGLSKQLVDSDRADEKYKRESGIQKEEDDPNSERSKMYQTLAGKYPGGQALVGKSATEIKTFLPTVEKLAEMEAKKQENYYKSQERKDAKQTIIDEKRRIAAKPSDKQVEAFTDLDNAESDLTNILSSLGSNSSWTGAIDGRIPDLLVGEDQAAFRSALGKYKDAYRKAITGAGAGPTEVAMLEGRLPGEKDNYKNFIAKANEAKKEISRKRDIYGSNLAKSGKDVSEFTKPIEPSEGDSESLARQKRIQELKSLARK